MKTPLPDITHKSRPGQANPSRSRSLVSIHRRGSHAAASLSVDPDATLSSLFLHPTAKDIDHG